MKKNENISYIGYWLRRFLTEYVTKMRNLSENTRKSYRDTFRLLLVAVSRQLHKDVDKLLLEDITSSVVTSFLNSLESERKCSVSTRNQRLAAIRALAKYISMNSPHSIEWCRGIRDIPSKKAARKIVHYLEKDEMTALLDAPDTDTTIGARDSAILLFLYNTGARASECASVCIKDVAMPEKKGESGSVLIMGKGNKKRQCPLWWKTCKALEHIIGNRSGEEPLFVNRVGLPFTRYGIFEMVTRYVKGIEKDFPAVKDKRVTPHTIRHTTATHLLQAGVDFDTIRIWLGHVSINTTHVYAEVSMEMKKMALELYEAPISKNKASHWRDSKKIMDFLNNL